MSQRATRIETGASIAVVMSIGFITFHSLPDGVPFLVRLAMMVATQTAVGKSLQREERRCAVKRQLPKP